MKNFLTIMFLLIAVAFPSSGASWNEEEYRKIEESIKKVDFPQHRIKVTKYGASPKATAEKNREAINKAIEECSKKGGGHVVIEGGEFLTGALRLRSNVNLVVEKDAKLQFVFQPELYPIVPTRWEGLDCWNLSPCIYAFKETNVAVSGEGTIDGGGSRETWWPWCGATKYGWKEGMISQRNSSRARLLKYAEDGVDMNDRRFGPEDGLRPQLIQFNQCDRVLVENVTLLRSPFWVLHPLLSKNVTVRGVQFINDGPNGDGCDPESCDGVLIENCFFNTGDDCIAIKSGRNNDGRLWNRPSENIIIRNCVMHNGHGGVVVGSEISGGCRNVYAENNKMDSPNLDRVVRIKTNSCRGGVIENINARNIEVGQCRESVLKINLDYEHNEICCRGFLPTVRNVNLENVSCDKSKYGVQIIALDTTVNVYDINVKDCRFNNVADGNYITGLTRDINFDNLIINGEKYDLSKVEFPIDRKAVLARNNPRVFRADSLSSLSVGNGHICATVDVTGLQSYPGDYANGIPLNIMSDRGWHSFPNANQLKREETEKSLNLHGHESVYAVEYKKGGRNQEATAYFRANPHRLNLATIGLELRDKSGDRIPLSAITEIDQQLNLWDGMIESKFVADGVSSEVTTGMEFNKDCLFARIKSGLLTDGRAKVSIKFSYPTGNHADDANDWNRNDDHFSSLLAKDSRSAVIKRVLDETVYYLLVQWEGDVELQKEDNHYFSLSSKDDLLSFSVEFLDKEPESPEIAYRYDQSQKNLMRSWESWWKSGAFVDFGRCKDSRARELERRTILSQYLTQINCANTTPPQETGLTYNSWFGRPHLEMAFWHLVDFSLWNRPQTLEKVMDWYVDTAYPEALKIAERQGFKGARWMKMTDPDAGEAPSNTGSFLTWQQPHFIYMAEELYRAKPEKTTLERYASAVESTAEFMADFAMKCSDTADNNKKVSGSAVNNKKRSDSVGNKKKGGENGKIALRGQTAMQESMSKDFSYHHPFEQAYWYYGLKTALKWRDRLGLERNPDWEAVADRLAPLYEEEGIYVAGRPLKAFEKNAKSRKFDPYVATETKVSAAISEEDFKDKSRRDHPAVLGACGLLPVSPLFEKEKMKATFRWISDNWNFDTTWGWDYGLMAMAAARLDMPEEAVGMLMLDKGKNTYLVNGHNFQEPKRLRLYLPGNGSLLDAVAMMCAGWDGCDETIKNPGFPQDGNWDVRWEGLRRMQ